METQPTPKVQCPKCGSEQFSANKKGFSGKKAAAGAILTGGIGLLAGTHGSGDVICTCLVCGHEWNPTKDAKRKAERERNKKHWKKMGGCLGITAIIIISTIIILIILVLLSS